MVIDVQNGNTGSGYERESVIANIASLVEKARGEDVPVVWVQHRDDNLVEGTEGWQFVPELVRDESEPLVPKSYGDAFEATELENVLADKQIGHLVVTGAQSDECIRCTIHGAFTRGYDVTLVGDAHTTEDLTAWGAPTPDKVVSHTNLYWRYQAAPGRTAAVVQTAEVDFAGQPETGK